MKSLSSLKSISLVPSWTRDHIKGRTCVHIDLNFKGVPISGECGKPVAEGAPHGWLCPKHEAQVRRKE